MEAFAQLKKFAAGLYDDLRQAVMIPQVDEQQLAMVAFAKDPAGETDGFGYIGVA
jgi:hypothetical protein